VADNSRGFRSFEEGENISDHLGLGRRQQWRKERDIRDGFMKEGGFIPTWKDG
jgi:hypothetical protein